MPRLTSKNYLRTHDRLRRLWLHDPRVFAELAPMEQWQLYDFFKPDKDWSDLELLQHREAITAERPSLPQRAGRALEKFWGTSAARALVQVRTAKAPAGNAKRVRQEDRSLTVKAVARPEIDAHKLARAYIGLARDLAKNRAAEQQSDHGPRTRP